MNRKAKGADGNTSDTLGLSPKEIEAGAKVAQAQLRHAFGMWTLGLQVSNSMVKLWTDLRRKAFEEAMRELIRAEKEPDLEKRAQIVANVISEQTSSALRDLLAASIRASHVGYAAAQKLAEENVKATKAAARDDPRRGDVDDGASGVG